MKKITYTLFVALLASLALTSCLGDEDKVEYSDYCSIKGFSLASLKQVHHLKGASGQDSVYYTSFSGVNFPMSINQRTLFIENPDSLPYGVMMDKVLTSCAFETVLVHRPQDLANLEPADTAWVTYSEKDTIDFSKPRHFLVLSSDGSSMRKYTVKVNVHQMDPDETVWDSLGVSALVVPSLCKARRMVVVDGNLVVLAQGADGALACYSRVAKKVGAWKQEVLTHADGLNVETLCQQGGILYASTTAGNILYSVDGLEWRSRLKGMPGLRLLGVSESCMYALADGKLMSSPKNSEVWKEETLDDEAGLLPAKDVTILAMTQKNGNEKLLLTGKSADGKAARQWAKTWNGKLGESAATWAYYGENAAIRNPYPLLKQSNVMLYDQGLLLFGGAPEVMNKRAENLVEEPLGRLYFSQDYGITWMKHDVMSLDENMTLGAAKASFITAAVEDGRFVWVLVDGQLWRGRLNSVLMK